MTIPKTTKTNCVEFCAAWMFCYGGTVRNAIRVWQVTYNEEHGSDEWFKPL